MSSHLYLHLLTVPSQRPDILDHLRASVTAPGNMSKPESIKTWLDENREAKAQEALVKTAYDGAFGEIVAIAWAVNYEPAQVLTRCLDGSESGLIAEFFATLLAQGPAFRSGLVPQWVGHNLLGFHGRFLYQRCVVNKVPPPLPLPLGRYNNAEAFDTLQAWAGWNKMVSLVDVAEALGFEANRDLSVPEVLELVKAEKFDVLEDLCAQSVDDVRAVHLRMTFAEEVTHGA